MLYLASSIILATLAILGAMWLGKRNPGHSARFTTGMILSLLLLPLTLLLPKWELDISYIQDAGAKLTTGSNTLHWILLAWLIGTCVLLTRLAIHYWAIWTWRKESQKCSTPSWTHLLHESCAQLKIDNIPSLALTPHISAPVVTGIFNPIILFPKSSENWDQETLVHVLLHELGHVKRHDLLLSVIAQIACAIHWFNPLIWILRKKQSAQCEFACDTYVLASGANVKSYINALCNVAEDATSSNPSDLALAMADKASLRQRVELLIHQKKAPSGTLIAVILLCTVTPVMALNLTHFIPQKTSSTPQKIYTPEEIETRLDATPFPADDE